MWVMSGTIMLAVFASLILTLELPYVTAKHVNCLLKKRFLSIETDLGHIWHFFTKRTL